MKIYISGSITSSITVDGRLDHFQRVKQHLLDAGFDVICPTDYPPATEIGWVACMQRDIGLVAQSDGIAIIDESPRTQYSHGVAIEIEVAQYLGKPIMSWRSWLDSDNVVNLIDWKCAESDCACSRRLVKGEGDAEAAKGE